MKFDCGPTWEERIRQLGQWHPYFAWLPIRLGSHDCRWLEWIERKGEHRSYIYDSYWSWEYRAAHTEFERLDESLQ